MCVTILALSWIKLYVVKKEWTFHIKNFFSSPLTFKSKTSADSFNSIYRIPSISSAISNKRPPPPLPPIQATLKRHHFREQKILIKLKLKTFIKR